MAMYSRFTMKWANKCVECGKRLEVGTYAYGTKDDLTKKWHFMCESCHDHSGDPNLKKEPEPKWATDANGDGDVNKYLELLGEKPVEEPARAITEACAKLNEKPKPSILDLIKENAQYGGM